MGVLERENLVQKKDVVSEASRVRAERNRPGRAGWVVAANASVLSSPNDVVQDQCKQRMNTFAFTGDLKNAPEVSCVYHSEEAENQYMNMLGKAPPMGKAPP